MKKLMITSLQLLCVLSIAYSQNPVQKTDTVSTIGFFDRTQILVNFETEKVSKINGYYISTNDITTDQLDSLQGKKVLVTGTLKIVKGIRHEAKSRSGGRVYEPYQEPDKKYIMIPVFTIV